MCSLYITYSYYLSNIYFSCALASSNSSYATGPQPVMHLYYNYLLCNAVMLLKFTYYAQYITLKNKNCVQSIAWISHYVKEIIYKDTFTRVYFILWYKNTIRQLALVNTKFKDFMDFTEHQKYLFSNMFILKIIRSSS